MNGQYKCLLPAILLLFLGCTHESQDRIEPRNTGEYSASIEYIYPIQIQSENGAERTLYMNHDYSHNYKRFEAGSSTTSSFDHSFIWVRAYELRNVYNLLLAYAISDSQAVWVGKSSEYDNIDALNLIVENMKMSIKSDVEAINLSKYFIKLSGNAKNQYLPLNMIDDIWIYAQYYDSLMTRGLSIENSSNIEMDFLHEEIIDHPEWVFKRPDEFGNYHEVVRKYGKIVSGPEVSYSNRSYYSKLFVWNMYSGEITQWKFKIDKHGLIDSLTINEIAKYTGIRRSGLTIMVDE